MKPLLSFLIKAILSFLFLVSIGLNVVLLSGCATIHDFVYGTPCKYAATEPAPQIHTGDDGREALAAIAIDLGLPTGERDAETLKHDIRNALSVRNQVPDLYDEESFTDMSKDLPPSKTDWVNSMREYQEFIRDLHKSKQITVIMPEN